PLDRACDTVQCVCQTLQSGLKGPLLHPPHRAVSGRQVVTHRVEKARVVLLGDLPVEHHCPSLSAARRRPTSSRAPRIRAATVRSSSRAGSWALVYLPRSSSGPTALPTFWSASANRHAAFSNAATARLFT